MAEWAGCGFGAFTLGLAGCFFIFLTFNYLEAE